jgi:hypothetical protein
MHNQRTFSGIIFEVWPGEQCWFWFVIDPYCDGGAIGVAAGENEAVRDACASIDGMLACLEPQREPSPEFFPMTAQGWEASLASLERYLNRIYNATA